MSKILDKNETFLSNYSYLFWGPLFIGTQCIIDCPVTYTFYFSSLAYILTNVTLQAVMEICFIECCLYITCRCQRKFLLVRLTSAGYAFSCISSVLWWCWLGDRKGIRVPKSWLLGTSPIWSIVTWNNSGRTGQLNKNQVCVCGTCAMNRIMFKYAPDILRWILILLQIFYSFYRIICRFCWYLRNFLWQLSNLVIDVRVSCYSVCRCTTTANVWLKQLSLWQLLAGVMEGVSFCQCFLSSLHL